MALGIHQNTKGICNRFASAQILFQSEQTIACSARMIGGVADGKNCAFAVHQNVRSVNN